MIYSSSFSYWLVDPLNHDPVPCCHHIDLNLVPALIDPETSDTPHYHIFLLLDSEALTQHPHVVASLDSTRDNSTQGIEVTRGLIVDQLDDIDAKGAFRVAGAQLGWVGLAVWRVAVVGHHFSQGALLGTPEVLYHGVDETADASEKFT